MPEKIKLSIIIVNFRSLVQLESCLGSLFGKKHLLPETFEVIVVNNDDCSDFSQVRSQFPLVKIIDHRKNVGFGAGCNLGVKKAQGEWLWFLNPDTTLIDDVRPIFAFCEANPMIGGVSPRLVDDSGKTQEWGLGVEITLLDIILNNLGWIRSKKIWLSKKPISCSWVSGASLTVKKSLFDKLNGFDENFFMYFEDVDLCRRIRKSGQKIFWLPQVSLRHIGGASRESELSQKSQFYQSQTYYFKKHFPSWHFWCLKMMRRIFG